jgi:hypothetical protein
MKVTVSFSIENVDIESIKKDCAANGITFSEYMRLAIIELGAPSWNAADYIKARRENRFYGTYDAWVKKAKKPSAVVRTEQNPDELVICAEPNCDKPAV